MLRPWRWLWRWWRRDAAPHPLRRLPEPPPPAGAPSDQTLRGPLYDDRAQFAGRDYETKA